MLVCSLPIVQIFDSLFVIYKFHLALFIYICFCFFCKNLLVVGRKGFELRIVNEERQEIMNMFINSGVLLNFIELIGKVRDGGFSELLPYLAEVCVKFRKAHRKSD